MRVRLCMFTFFSCLSFALAIFTGCSTGPKPDTDEKSSAHTNVPAEHEKSIVILEVKAQRSIGLEVEAARFMPFAESILATAVVMPNETRVAHLKPLSRGRVTHLGVRTGDRVRAGQALLVYDNIEAGDFVGEYRAAAAALEKATAEADVSKRSMDRAQNLIDLGAIAQAEFDRRAAQYKTALAAVNSSKAEIDKIAERLRRIGFTKGEIDTLIQSPSRAGNLTEATLGAPFGGIISAMNVAEGEIIDSNQELMTLSDLSTVWVQGDVYERDLAQIREGRQADILTDVYPAETFRGRITYVSDFLDPQTRTAKVRCEVTNPESRLKVGMFARIHIRSSDARRALAVPEAALQIIDQKTLVFVRTAETIFERRDITSGTRSGNLVEVVAGLKEGDLVVTHGTFSLKSALLRDRIGGEEH